MSVLDVMQQQQPDLEAARLRLDAAAREFTSRVAQWKKAAP
jgi:hypothetical protein